MPPASHRERLLAAAKTLLAEREYGAITARDLVSASGTNLGSIGYHFGSKDALLNVAIGEVLEEWGQAAIDAATGDPMEQLVGALARIIDSRDRVRPYYQAFLAAVARCAHAPDLQLKLADHYTRQRDRVATLVVSAFGSEPPEALKALAVAVVDGLLLQNYVDPENTPTAEDIVGTCRALLGK